jgi:rRNA maturation RNase YbeY
LRLRFVCAPGCRAPHGTRAPLAALARRLSPLELEVELVVARDALLRRLNRTFRGLDRVTDVLSFRYDDGAAGEPRDRVRGAGPDAEIYVSLTRTAVQARELGHSPAVEFVRLGVHGLHHLQGHDHHTRAEARRMRAAEDRSLRWLERGWPRFAARPLVPLLNGSTRGTG